MAVVNRRAPSLPSFTVEEDGDTLTLRTDALTLTHRRAPKGFTSSTPHAFDGFTSDNMCIRVHATGVSWCAGQTHDHRHSGALHGTIRTLDRLSREHSLACTQTQAYLNDSHCVEGVVARDGWALIDDTWGPRWQDLPRDASVDAAGNVGEAWKGGGGLPSWQWIGQPAEMPPPAAPDTCTAVGWERYECLWGNVIDEAGCIAKGCCFDAHAAAAANGQPTDMHFVPWCYWATSPASRPGYTDYYFFGHGHDYTAALADYRLISGRVPQLPRAALGPHYSRWFDYHDFEERDIVNEFTRNGVPLDVMVVDMGWHYTFDRGVPNVPPGVKVEPWTGFTINPMMLPSPTTLMEFMHARGVSVVFNQHPHFGVQFFDSRYDEMARRIGRDPAEKRALTGNYTDPTWTWAFFDLVIRDLDAAGVDWHWLDWQAGEWTPLLGLSPTIWLSYVFTSSPVRYGSLLDASDLVNASRAWDRPVALNRWGGWGHHRYPVGFSGDADTTWDSLRFQAVITPTAANVAWQWSHDIGGFQGAPSSELMVRWVQFGVFSPILRPHTAGRFGSFRDIWLFPLHAFHIMRDFFRLRARLIPYLVQAQRYAYDTGIATVRPLYYSFPRLEDAYSYIAQHQYWFGPSILAAPITHPATPGSPLLEGYASSVVWLPPGTWIEWFSWQLITVSDPGGAFVTRTYSLAEIPLFSRPGTILPMRTLRPDLPLTGASSAPIDDLTFWVFPHFDRGDSACGIPTSHRTALEMYDDDGMSVGYLFDEFVRYNVSCAWTSTPTQSAVTCIIGASQGKHYPGIVTLRKYTLRFISALPPSTVYVGADIVQHAQWAAPDVWGDNAPWPRNASSWAYDVESSSVWVHVDTSIPIDTVLTIRAAYSSPSQGLVSKCGEAHGAGVVGGGAARIIERAKQAKRIMNKIAWQAFAEDVPSLMELVSMKAKSEALLASPSMAAAGMLAALSRVPDLLRQSIVEVELLRSKHDVDEEITSAMLQLLRT